METAQECGVINESVTAFFAREYPLLKLFSYGDEILVYDAKPHLAFILSATEMDALIDCLRGDPAAEMEKSLFAKFTELQSGGVFIKGPAAEISPVDKAVIGGQLAYYDENILLRKFCLEVTEDCNFRCTYCKRTIAADFRSHAKNNLSEEKAVKGILYYFEKYTAFFQRLSDEKKALLLQIMPPCLAWYGGEPLLNFELIKKSADFFKSLPWDNYGIKISDLRYTSNTNLSIINDEILNFLVDNKVSLFASLDGPAEEHDKCRVFENGAGTFQVAYQNLMKVKEFNAAYFREHVSIFAVYTEQHDYARCVEFTRNIGALMCQHFPAEYTGVFVNHPDDAVEAFTNSFESRLAEFKRGIRPAETYDDSGMEQFSNLFPFAKIKYDHPAGGNALHISLTCPMGYDNLMLAANGEYLICHKVGGCMPIGGCDTGLDMEKLIDLNQRYNSAINNDECKSCWNVNFCNVCAAGRMTRDDFINPAKKECDYFRLRAAYDFSCFIYLSREHPDLLRKIFAYRNNRKNYIGLIDFNDF